MGSTRGNLRLLRLAPNLWNAYNNFHSYVPAAMFSLFGGIFVVALLGTADAATTTFPRENSTSDPYTSSYRSV